MDFYKFIKIKCKSSNIGYFVPRLYKLDFAWWELKAFGLQFVKERLKGWTIWWVSNEDDYRKAVETLNELKEICIFDFKVTE